MKSILILLFMILSICAIVGFFVYALCFHDRDKSVKKTLSSVHICTIGVWVGAVLSFVPLYYTAYDLGDNYGILRPFLLSIHSALRLFILEGDYSSMREMISDLPTALRVVYSLYSTLLFVGAPALTFTTVLSLFKNFSGMVRYALTNKKKIVVMSELNEKSLELANSIKGKDSSVVVVFTDVFTKDEERDFEMMQEAKKLNAICLKIDVTQLNIYSKKADFEIFFIGNDESENVRQAVKITEELNRENGKKNVKLFVFALKESNAYIIDSVRYDNLLKHASDNNYGEGTFKLRRVDEIRQLVWNTVPGMNVFELAQKNDNTLSVLIVGMGMYGMEYFKALLWYCQFDGYKLNLTVVDSRADTSDKKTGIKSAVNHRFPDLMKYNKSTVDGDAYYDIEIIEGIDMAGNSFDELACYAGEDKTKKELSERIRKTNIVIVSLGDDDINIEASVKLRSLFDRIHDFKADSKTKVDEELVQIYSVVYDEQKAGLLHHDENNEDSGFLINYDNIPYNIHFIGSMANQFQYESIYDSNLETDSKKHHTGWVEVEAQIHKELTEQGRTDLLAHYGNELNYRSENSEDAKRRNEERYEKFEYYRLSSVAKEMYRRAINGNDQLRELTACKGTGGQSCMCENCVRRKKSEHMRWNAYTRINGYIFNDGEKRGRAMQHNNLVGWSGLSRLNQMKD